jgi:hypothetical protein
MKLRRLNIYKKLRQSKRKPISKEEKEFAERYAAMSLEEMDKYHDEVYKEFCENNPLIF